MFGFEVVDCTHMAGHQLQWRFFFTPDAESTLSILLTTVVDNALLSQDSGLLGRDPVVGNKRLSTFRKNTSPVSSSVKKA